MKEALTIVSRNPELTTEAKTTLNAMQSTLLQVERLAVEQANNLHSIKNPGRIQSRINIQKGEGTSNKTPGLENAWRKHGKDAKDNKSQFTISKEELVNILQDKKTIQAPVKWDTETGAFVREVDVGKVVGNLPRKKGEGPTSTITVLTDKYGNLISTYPGSFKYLIQ